MLVVLIIILPTGYFFLLSSKILFDTISSISTFNTPLDIDNPVPTLIPPNTVEDAIGIVVK